MRLPYDLLSGTYKSPNVFLCDVDKAPICKLNATGLKGSFKFNAYSEISFEIGRTYVDQFTCETKIFPFYDMIETPRLIKLDGFGYFEIQGPELSNNGIKESQTVTAYSLEYTLSYKYLENFQINTGASESVEVGYAYDTYYEQYGDDYINYISPVTLYNDTNPKLSLLHLAIEKAYGWKINHVDDSLKTLSRKFEVDRQSIYDFLINEVCEKFNCYVVFDTENNEINVYAESKTAKFIGDGETNQFIISPKFGKVNTVSVDGYKTTKWDYIASTGVLILEDTPQSGAHIEAIDGDLTDWETDVFVTFENLAQEINVSYDSDEIKTQLTVTYGDGRDIREANLGIPYLTDLSYYYTVDWMGQELYDAYTAYMQKSQNSQAQYKENSEKILDVTNRQNFEERRLSMGYGKASVLPDTVGTYYVRGGSSPNYYYTEVSLPADYDANVQYYKLNGTNLNTGKVTNLYNALQKYFNDGALDDFIDDTEDKSDLTDEFSFMTTYKISNLYTDLKAANTKDEAVKTRDEAVKTREEAVKTREEAVKTREEEDTTQEEKEEIKKEKEAIEEEKEKIKQEKNAIKQEKEIAVNKFLDEMWNEVGRTPLQKSYKEPYEKQQTQFVDYAKEDHKDYSYYYATVLILDSIKKAIDIRTNKIDELEKEYQKILESNTSITASLAMDQNFTENELIRLSAFIREDEIQLDDIVETDEDTIADSFKIKEDAIESGRIELHKLSQPKLQFSMTMANIYALKDFEPIIDQFQLGNVIKVGLRKDYIKQSRLLQVDLEFDNLSSLSTEFGELTNLRTQSDIHADLLGQAISAGKSVAQNSANWTKGSDTANSTDLRIQNGLLDAATVLKSIDGTQGVEMGKYGIKMTKVINQETGEIDPKQGWIVNNMFAYTDNNWKTTKTVLGEFQLTGEENSRWGLLADAVIAGYVEGSHIIGGDIKIGDIGTNAFPFQVNSEGDMTATSATIKGNSTIAGWNVTDQYIDSTVSDSKQRLYISSASDTATNWICATDSEGKNTFYVTKEGKAYATSGEIGGFTLGDTSIYNTKTSYNSETDGVYLGTDGIGLGNKKFYVTSAGELTAKSGTIETCNINNCTIDDNCTINGKLSVSQITSGTNSETITFSGNITCNNIDAKGGFVGGWSIGTNQISGSNESYRALISKSNIGTSGIVFGVYNGSTWSAYIDGQGKLVASGAEIKGNSTLDSCTISNCTIQNTCTINGKLSASNITAGTTSSEITLGNLNATGGTIKNLTITGKLSFGGDSNYYINANYNDTSYYLNLPGLKIDAASGAVFTKGTVTIKDGLTVQTDGGAVLQDWDGGIRIYASNYDPYFIVRDTMIYNRAGSTYFYMLKSKDDNGNSVYIDADYGIKFIAGTSGYLVGSWYLNNSSTAVTSDENKKNTIVEIDEKYDVFFDNIGCYTFKYNEGTSDRLHCGFISQRIKNSLDIANIDTKDFGGVVIKYNDDGTEDWYVRYEEFIALNTWQIQKLKTRVAELENRLAALEERN